VIVRETYYLEHVQRVVVVPAAGAGVASVIVVVSQEEPERARSRGRPPGAEAPVGVAAGARLLLVLRRQVELGFPAPKRFQCLPEAVQAGVANGLFTVRVVNVLCLLGAVLNVSAAAAAAAEGSLPAQPRLSSRSSSPPHAAHASQTQFWIKNT
jgi:hypothetical protein